MIRSSLVAIVIAFVGSTNAVAQSARQDVLPELTPRETAPPSVVFRSNTNFDELRTAYAMRADFDERCELNRPGDQFMEHINSKDYLGAARITEEWLVNCPVDASIHMWSAAAYHEGGDQANADVHRRWFEGLTDSALRSGDGKSSGSAIVTISIKEEYAVLSRLGLEAEGQSLVQGPPVLDLLQTRDKQGNKGHLFFNPHWHFIRLEHKVRDENQ